MEPISARAAPVAWVLALGGLASVAHFLALSPATFEGSAGHQKLLAPYGISERHLVIPRARHGDPGYSGASDVAGYIEDAEELHATGRIGKVVRHPLLTYATAAVFAATGRCPMLYYLMPLGCYLASLWLVRHLALRFFDGRSAACAALLAGLHPTLMLSSLSYNSHAVSPLVNLAAFCLFLEALQDSRRWVPLMAVLGLGRLVRLENIALAGFYPALAFILRRRFPDRVSTAFGRHFWLGVLAWFAVTLPYHWVQWIQFGNPLHPFELRHLLQGKPDDPLKYTGHEGPFKMFALFFLAGSWTWPFLFWKGAREMLRGRAAPCAWAFVAILAFWFAGFSMQAVTDPNGIHVIFGILLVALPAGGGLAALRPGARRWLATGWVAYALAAQVLFIHFCQFLYGEGHAILWGLGLDGAKRWIVALPFWKFGNP